MEARGEGGICAGEPASAFGMVQFEGEKGIYVQYLPEDGSMKYLVRELR